LVEISGIEPLSAGALGGLTDQNSRGQRFLPASNKKRKRPRFLSVFGGDNRDRTDDLLNAIQALSPSYSKPALTAFEV